MTFKKNDRIKYTIITANGPVFVEGIYLSDLGNKSATVKLQKNGGFVTQRVLKDKLTKLGEQ